MDPGSIVAGHTIVRPVGRGGMGIVYEAIDPDGETVALKLLKPEKAVDEATVQDFENEACATGSVDHDNVVTVLGHGFADGFHYIKMELVGGPPLSRTIEVKKRLPWRDATGIVMQVARALECAHEKGLVHRDVKPENVLLYEDGRARLTDFGIVKDISTLQGFLLKGEKVGTAAYASPEQVLGKRLDAATDMYSLGATFYRMVCGRYAFTGASPNEIMNKHVKGKLIPPSVLVPDIPKPLSNVIEKMLAKKRTDRYPTMERLLRDLTLLLEGKVAIADQGPRVDHDSLRALTAARRPKPGLGRKPKVPAEVVLVTCLVAVIGAFLLLMLLG